MMEYKAILIFKLWSMMLGWQQVYYPPSSLPETRSEYVQRLGGISQVVVEEGLSAHHTRLDPIDQMAIVIVLWKHEAALDYSVHGGPPLVSPIGTQDNGRARCLGQIQHTPSWMTREQWLSLTGFSPEATARCAYWTNDMMQIQVRHCLPKGRRAGEVLKPSEAALLFAGYGQGLSCVPKNKHWQRAYEFDRTRLALWQAIGNDGVKAVRKMKETKP